MKVLQLYLFAQVFLVGLSDAWTTPLTNKKYPLPKTASTNHFSHTVEVAKAIDTKEEMHSKNPVFDTFLGVTSTSLLALVSMSAFPEQASAALPIISSSTVASSTILNAGGSIASALFAYGHYFSVIGIVGVLMTERWTLENGPNLTEDEENRLAIADVLYGLIAVVLIYTGYCRVTDPVLGKGASFYLHEPIFWLKMTMLGVVGASSLFNTTKIIQRSVTRFTAGDSDVEPMSEALCDRMKSICNAQLTGIVFIPMAATFMARGIGYNESFPWQVEAAGALLIFLGLGFKYVNEALTFEARLSEAEKEAASTGSVISSIEQ